MHRKLPLATEDLGSSHSERRSASTLASGGAAMVDGRSNHTDLGYMAQTALALSRAVMEDAVALLNSRTLDLGSLDDETGRPPPQPSCPVSLGFFPHQLFYSLPLHTSSSIQKVTKFI